MQAVNKIILTGAGGLVGSAIVDSARRLGEPVEVVALHSRAQGGTDLARLDAWQELLDTVAVEDPKKTAVIHAAAHVSWEDARSLTDNPVMAWNVAKWMAMREISFGHFVSTVSVISDEGGGTPKNLYGIGKLAAEHVWAQQLGSERSGISRLAGVLGLTNPHGMFWTKVLLSVRNSTSSPELSYNPASTRNYLTAIEAAECILHLTIQRRGGMHVVAGRDEVRMDQFVQLLRALSGSKLSFRESASCEDRVVYSPSQSIAPVLMPFRERISELWTRC